MHPVAIAMCKAASATLLLMALVGCTQPAPKRTERVASTGFVAQTQIDSVEPWSFNGKDGRIFRTANYRVYTTQPDTVLNSRLPSFLESALRHYRTAITGEGAPLPGPEIKLDTYVLRNREDWALLTRQLTADQADIFLRIPRGGFAFGGKALLFDIGARDTLAIAAHEGWHQYTQRAFQQPLPIWLEEGLATVMEGHRFEGRGEPQFLPWFNTQRFDLLRKAHTAGRLVSLRDLLADSPGDLLAGGAGAGDRALIYYAQVWALSHFLLEGDSGVHRASLNQLVSDAALGKLSDRLSPTVGAFRAAQILSQRRGPVVFEAYFGPVGARSDQYDRFISELVRAGSRERVVEGASPIRNLPTQDR